MAGSELPVDELPPGINVGSAVVTLVNVVGMFCGNQETSKVEQMSDKGGARKQG